MTLNLISCDPNQTLSSQAMSSLPYRISSVPSTTMEPSQCLYHLESPGKEPSREQSLAILRLFPPDQEKASTASGEKYGPKGLISPSAESVITCRSIEAHPIRASHPTPSPRLTSCLSHSEHQSGQHLSTFHCTHLVRSHQAASNSHPASITNQSGQQGPSRSHIEKSRSPMAGSLVARNSRTVSKWCQSGGRAHLSRSATVWTVLAVIFALLGAVFGLPQTSPTSYHQRRHQQPSPSAPSPYSPSQPGTYASTYQHQHHYHNKYHPFNNHANKVQHQSKSSSLRLDSNLQPNSTLVNSPVDASNNASCPNCGLRLNQTQAENLKLEAIKQQILSKLNLVVPPKITRDRLKREQALEAIRKAKLNAKLRRSNGDRASGKQHKRKRHSRRESDMPVHRRLSFPQLHSNSTFNTSSDPESDDYDQLDYLGYQDGGQEESSDEYYGKTSEIIAFAEPGRNINGHTLVDLIPPHDNLHKLAVSKAVLWVRLTFNRSLVRRLNRNPILDSPITLYIFKVDKSHSSRPMPAYPTPFFQSNDASLGTSSEWNPEKGENETTRLSYELLTTHRLAKPSRGWTQIDLTTAVSEWFQRSSNTNQKLTLLIDCAGCKKMLDIDLVTRNPTKRSNQKGSNPRAINTNLQTSENDGSEPRNLLTAITSHSENRDGANGAPNQMDSNHRRTNRKRRHFQPFVVITTRTKLKRRNRRHAYNCEDGIKQCCKQSLYVDFAELGWDDWIIFPKGYTANYCMGECVQLHRTPDVMAYFHSHVLEEYRMKNPYASITPCCAPTKLSSISLIYFDPDGHIIKSDLPKMVVDECGCT